MTVRINNKRYDVQFIRALRNSREVWSVSTIRGRWLGTFNVHTDDMATWKRQIRRLVRNAT